MCEEGRALRGAIPAGPHMEEIMLTLEDDFMWITSHAFSEMRLLVEGALNLFEDDAGILCRLARNAGKINQHFSNIYYTATGHFLQAQPPVHIEFH